MRNIKDITDLILGITTDNICISTLQLALRQARRLIGYNSVDKKISKRDFEERMGVAEENPESDMYSKGLFSNANHEEMDAMTALSLYLIILDQLGHIFDKKKVKSVKIEEAIDLVEPPLFKSDEAKAITNLRNSLNHNFGLANCYKGQGTHKFVLHFKSNEDIPIVLPTTEWDGIWSNKSESSSCHIHVFAMCKSIESIVSNIIEQYKEGKLYPSISDAEELATRFTINVE